MAAEVHPLRNVKTYRWDDPTDALDGAMPAGPIELATQLTRANTSDADGGSEAQIVGLMFRRDPAAAERYVTDRLAQAAQRLLDAPVHGGAQEHMRQALSARTELRRLQGGVS